jgi:hypothetical protein
VVEIVPQGGLLWLSGLNGAGAWGGPDASAKRR